MYEISVARVFAAAHAIRLPDGSLEPVHGHNWSVLVTVGSSRLDGIETVMDFHDLEQALDTALAKANNRHLNEVPPFVGPDGRLAVNPTAERVAWWIGQEIAAVLPRRVKLISVAVGEAPGCTAVYRP
jgi:6-pyruvoyl-tetrahydropterin synthase